MRMPEGKKSLFLYENERYKFSDYKIDNDMIVPVQGATQIKYDPFKYFHEKRKQYARENYQNIHTSFASINIDNLEEILNWVKLFGVPYSKYKDEMGKYHINFPTVNRQQVHKVVDEISVDDFKRSVIDFKVTVTLINALKKPVGDNLKFIKHIVHTRRFKDIYDELESKAVMRTTQADEEHTLDGLIMEWENTSPMTREEMKLYEESYDWVKEYGGEINLAEGYIALYLEHVTKDVNETYTVRNGELLVGWNAPSLLGLLYKMLILEWSKGADIIKCHNKTCNKFFLPNSNNNNRYCSEECSNSERQRVYRKNHEKELAEKRKQKSKKIKVTLSKEQ